MKMVNHPNRSRQTATEARGDDLEALRNRSVQVYRAEMHFNRTVQAIVGRVLSNHGPVDPEKADREAYDIATACTAMLLQAIYEDDAQICFLAAERDHFKKLAEGALAISFKPPFFITSPPSP